MSDTESNGWTIFGKAIAGIGNAFVTPLSLIAVVFFLSYKGLLQICAMMGGKENANVSILKGAAIVFMAIIVATATTLLCLTIFKPSNLIYDKNANLLEKGIAPLGSDLKPKSSKASKPTTPKE